MNSITITGNIGKDAELRRLPDGTAVCSFSVADNQGKEKPSIWWNCSLFGKRGEPLQQYLVKGQQVTVIGNVIEREFTDKEGAKRKSMDIRINDVALQGGRKEQAPASYAPPANATAPAPRQQARNYSHSGPEPLPTSGFDDMSDDIPF